ncbi:glutaminyl-peptide cyclotransferase [Mycobacterium sp. MYCO198283]|uniref:glutaminyl-peptide cyclotransferase n=1 Tax=Mycobacterium sp. MYCO198283 TaxID=2883505 RepID=UPI001E38E739|nr:glutaminyl-peptide cyclotransferase [Mycobacterium sp. MYCO198283]MCG5432777.1 glutaminyl-peptide cyclotransferase [Mycobacterium sp. MYCO198283]
MSRYSDRVARITRIVESVVDLSGLLPNTSASNPVPLPNGLACSWGEYETGMTRVSVHINAVDDAADELRSLRDQVNEFAYRNHRYDPSAASEVPMEDPDVHVFVFGCFAEVKVLVDHCRVDFAVVNRDFPLATLIEPAIEIGRTIGCSPYEDDFVGPDFPDRWRKHRIVMPPFEPLQWPDE